jgi:hypothetical protein
MCDACDQRLSRRRLLRGAVSGITGAIVVAATAGRTLAQPPGLADPAAGEDGQRGITFTSGAGASRTSTMPAGVTLARSVPNVNLSGPAAPRVLSRAEWGADETLRAPQRSFAPIRKLIVHHTASANRPSDPADVVRSVYRYHTVTRGFSDLGYNFMIDHHGVIYEGRYARRYGNEPISGEDHQGWGVVGAHAKNMNAGTCGICLIGDFDTGTPTDAAVASLTALLAWKSGRHRIDASTSDHFENVYGDWAQFGNLAGHRAVGETECPGTTLAAALPGLRQEVERRAGSWPTLVVDLPRLQRFEWTAAGQGPLDAGGRGSTPNSSGNGSGPSGSGSGSGSGSSGSGSGSSSGSGSGSGSSGAGTGASATHLAGYRVLTATGQVLTTGKGTDLGDLGAGDGAPVSLAAPGWGDGFATLTATGHVRAFGTVGASGVVAVPHGARAVGLALTPSGSGAWVLLDNTTVARLGDAGRFGSVGRATLATTGVAIAAHPSAAGYWVLTSDGRVQGFGAAVAHGGPGSGGSPAVDLASTASGTGYWVLRQDGSVTAFGDAGASSGLAGRSGKWSRPAVAITRAGRSGGFVISAADGGLFGYLGAPWLGSFAGSGATVVGVVTAQT